MMSFKIKGKIIIDSNIAELIKKNNIYSIFRQNIKKKEGRISSGDLVSVYSANKNEFLGVGFFETWGNVAIHLMTFDTFHFNEDTIYERLKNSKILRSKMGFIESYRWVNSAADELPGLIIDKYNDLAVIESTNSGFDKIIDTIAEITMKIDKDIKAVYVRNDTKYRKNNEMLIWKGFVGDPIITKTRTIINEGNAKFYVDIENGNKTGFYLDQRSNRLEFSLYSKSYDNVLDCFSYTGGFGIHALLNDCKVTFVENDKTHLKLLAENLKLNDISDGYNIVSENFWEFAKTDIEYYDVIILDPPSFISSRKEKELGLRKYINMNKFALERLEINGLLISSSCSYFLDAQNLQSIILKLAKELGIKLVRLGRVRGASPCHLVNPNISGLEYLKCYFFMRIE